MDKRVRAVPVIEMAEEMRNQLRDGYDVTLKAKGYSMSPYIRNEKDLLTFSKVDPATLKVGDVVIAKTTANQIVAHRIIKADNDTLVLMGDGNIYGTETCRREDVIGLLTAVIRNGRVIDCNKPIERAKAAVGRTLRRFVYRTYSVLKRTLMPNKGKNNKIKQ